MKKLIMIPAFGCDARLYAPQTIKLKGLIDVHIPIVAAPSFDDMVQELLAQLPDDFAVLGTSMGGRLAMELAIAAPERVDALCVIGAAAGGVADAVAGRKRSKRIRAGEGDNVIKEMAEKIPHLPGPRGAATRQAFIEMGLDFDRAKLALQSDALAARTDIWDEVAHIICPTLCLWGAEDSFTPAADGLRLAHDVEDGGFTEIPACGHFPTLEHPEEANESILAWLEDAELI